MASLGIDSAKLEQYVSEAWDTEVIPSLCEFIKIPSVSPNYDANWVENGKIHQSIQHLKSWADGKNIKGYKSEVIDRKNGDEHIPPLLLITIDATNGTDDTALLYGHADVQPPLTAQWTVAGPWTPEVVNDKLYGRGSCDDGYAIYAAILAIKAVQDQNIPHGKIVVFIESEEESGSKYLNYYLDFLINEKNLRPSFVSILDSGGNDHDHLWTVSSLRGIIDGVLRVEVASGSVHSGAAGNCLPNPFRIARSLLSRIEDEDTGKLKLPELQADIPARRRDESMAIANLLGDSVWNQYNFLEGVYPTQEGKPPTVQQIADINLGISWHSSVAVVGVSHAMLPDIPNAGNTINPYVEFKISVRLAPGLDPSKALAAVARELTRDPPYGAHVTFKPGQEAQSFCAPIPQQWLDSALNAAAQAFYGSAPMANGRGGSIPFIAEFTAKFPGCDVMVTGPVGPDSYMHGPNENLHIPSAKKITCVLACLLSKHGSKGQ